MRAGATLSPRGPGLCWRAAGASAVGHGQVPWRGSTQAYCGIPSHASSCIPVPVLKPVREPSRVEQGFWRPQKLHLCSHVAHRSEREGQAEGGRHRVCAWGHHAGSRGSPLRAGGRSQIDPHQRAAATEQRDARASAAQQHQPKCASLDCPARMKARTLCFCSQAPNSPQAARKPQARRDLFRCLCVCLFMRAPRQLTAG